MTSCQHNFSNIVFEHPVALVDHYVCSLYLANIHFKETILSSLYVATLSYSEEMTYINTFLTMWYCKYNPYTPLIVMKFGEVWPIIQVNYHVLQTYRYNNFWFFIHWNFKKIYFMVRLLFRNFSGGTELNFSLIMYWLLY